MTLIPENIILSVDKTNLTLEYPNKSYMLTAEFLRVHSPSAEVQGHSPDQKVTVSGKKNVAINKVEIVGNYAIRILYTDAHDTGIYTWQYLHDLSLNKDKLWEDYISELRKKALSECDLREFS